MDRIHQPPAALQSDDISASNVEATSLGSRDDEFGPGSEKKAIEEYPECGLTSTVHEGEQKFHSLGWKKLTICLLVEAIALGSLSIPKAFATVGMVAGVILTVVLGLIAIYTGYNVGLVKLRYPAVAHYSDAVRLIWGRTGYEIVNVMFTVYLVMLVGSHALSGTIALVTVSDLPHVCALVWSVVAMVVLLLLSLPPTFSEFAILGYIDFASIVIAIGVTVVATGIDAHNAPGGLAAVPWSAWPPPDTTLAEAFLATSNIILAYAFAVCQFSFMTEMHTPKDFVKSIWWLGGVQIVIYTLVGALVYAFVGESVQSPALLSAGSTVSRVAFGIALPVIFISGSINTTVVGRFILDRAFPDSSIRYINTKAGWLSWIAIISTLTVIAWVIAEGIPIFNALLGLISALFISGFSYYFPALFWFQLLKEDKWYSSRKNISLTVLNGIVLVFGLLLLGLGTYASVEDIINEFHIGKVRSAFTCDSSAYS
ncbi:Hypothetical protein R9X50_00350400 [Acrodontium crateriforme]|uniref:Amino acid transporter transmembrane domain-containing protein n=1 Tax=Acrodontium crateriforme TaxID=150365 RepID=A0AAQ3R7I1_9PEZI|nr:Hypothetical protein R9X50_00350400 [Acrodontium crateriforme]